MFISFLLTFVLVQCGHVSGKGEFDNIQDLEQFVKEEFKHFRENENQLNHKIAVLEKENEEKGVQMKQMEEEIKQLKQENQINQRSRRQSISPGVAFTAYQTKHIHSLTNSQAIIYEHVSKILIFSI